MNQDTFIFEELYQRELNRIYEEKGYKVIKRIKGKENEAYDLILENKDGNKAKIEEKALQYYHPDCPIELIQNILPLDLGWFYKTEADFIHFFYYQDLQPKVLYQLKLHSLKHGIQDFFKERGWRENIKLRFSIINYGITINLCIKWEYLINKKIAFIFKSWELP